MGRCLKPPQLGWVQSLACYWKCCVWKQIKSYERLKAFCHLCPVKFCMNHNQFCSESVVILDPDPKPINVFWKWSSHHLLLWRLVCLWSLKIYISRILRTWEALLPTAVTKEQENRYKLQIRVTKNLPQPSWDFMMTIYVTLGMSTAMPE